MEHFPENQGKCVQALRKEILQVKSRKLNNHDPSKDFKAYLINQSVATVKANHGKSISSYSLGKTNAVVLAPGWD